MPKSLDVESLKNEKVSKLIWKYALPSMIGTAVNALYNIIDRIFIGHGLGDTAMGALGIVLPVMMIMTAFGMLVARGAGNRVSIYLGRKDDEMVDRIVGGSFLLSFIITVIVIVGFLIFLDPLLRLIGITNETLIYAKDFLYFYLPGSLFLSLCWCFNNMLRASGHPRKSMITMLLGVLINLILAPLFIFVFKWGIRGAALATVISMFSGFCYAFIHFIRPKSSIRIHVKYIKFNFRVFKDVLSIGISPFCIQIVSATIIFLIIHELEKYGGQEVLGAYTIVYTLLFVVIMLLTGLTQGIQPIIGYNYGADNYHRVRVAIKYTVKVGVVIGCLGLVIGEIFPYYFAMLFNPSHELAQQTVKAMRIVTIFLPLVAFQITVTNFFLSMGKALKSVILSLSRQFLFFIPVMFICSHLFKLNGVWISMPVADFLSFVVAVIFFYLQIKQLRYNESIVVDHSSRK